MSSSSSSSSLVFALVALLAVSRSAFAQEPVTSVYVPGNADEVPGVALVPLGVGADGMSSWDVGGVTLVENGQQAMLTQYTPQGAVVYNCQLGANGIADCAVQQLYDNVQYTYQEPITYFGQTTAAVPGAAVTPVSSSSSPDPAAATPTTSPTEATLSRVVPTIASASLTPSSKSGAGPQPSDVQRTASNVFGADTANGGAARGTLANAGLLLLAVAGAATLL